MIHMMLSEAASHIDGRHLGTDVNFKGCSTDSRKISDGELFIALKGERFDGHDYLADAMTDGAVAAMVQTQINESLMSSLFVNDTRQAMGQLAGAWRESFTIPVIAITGSNGKTTVKEMIDSILSREAVVLSTHGNMNNEIGVPLTLFALGAEHRYVVIEMGANHPGEIENLTRIVKPTVAIITLCAPAHLEGFGSVEGVAKAKSEIFEGLQVGGTAIINMDDQYASLWRKKADGYRQIRFSLKQEADVYSSAVKVDRDTGISNFILHTPVGEIQTVLPLPGVHNLQNALAAAACCHAVNIPLLAIKEGLESMEPVKGRLQLKYGMNGMCIYDDTYNANPSSLEAALQAISGHAGKLWLVLGDMGELGVSAKSLHLQAGKQAKIYGVERLYALGPLSRQAVDGFGAEARHFESMEDLLASLLSDVSDEVNILIKGSRYMGMEKVVNTLVEGN